MDVSDIDKFNDWWITGKVRPALLKNFKRETYHEINKYMENRLMILLYGLRRMGKTTIMYQLIDELLNKTDSKNISTLAKAVTQGYQRGVPENNGNTFAFFQ